MGKIVQSGENVAKIGNSGQNRESFGQKREILDRKNVKKLMPVKVPKKATVKIDCNKMK